MFRIPVTIDHVALQFKIHQFSPRAELIRHACAIIWDELPMANKADWECVHQLCCLIRNRFDLPFSGIPTFGIGDMRQVAPVISGAGLFASLAASVKSSPLWKATWIHTLNTAMRSINDPESTEFIDAIGTNSTNDPIYLPMLANTTNIHDTTDFLFPPNILSDPNTCLECAFLSACNLSIDEFNDIILKQLPGDFGMLALTHSS